MVVNCEIVWTTVRVEPTTIHLVDSTVAVEVRVFVRVASGVRVRVMVKELVLVTNTVGVGCGGLVPNGAVIVPPGKSPSLQTPNPDWQPTPQ